MPFWNYVTKQMYNSCGMSCVYATSGVVSHCAASRNCLAFLPIIEVTPDGMEMTLTMGFLLRNIVVVCTVLLEEPTPSIDILSQTATTSGKYHWASFAGSSQQKDPHPL